MLGVTLFGVLLTPVFYVVVDRLAAGRIFHSGFARWIGTGFMNVVALRLPRRAVGWGWSKASAGFAARRPFVSGS